MATKDEKLSSNNLTIILVLVTLLVVGASGLIVKSLITSITLNNKVASAKNKANNQLTADVSAAPQLVDAYTALGTQQQVLADALPNVADFPSLIVTINNMTNDAGLQLTSISPATLNSSAGVAGGTVPPSAVGTPSPATYQFSIQFDGTYDGLVKMMGDIETSARPMRVDGLQLNGSSSSLAGEIDLETFYQAAGQLPFSEETIK